MVQATQDQIMATLRQDVDQMEKSKIWPFSCYAVVKEMKVYTIIKVISNNLLQYYVSYTSVLTNILK